MRKLRFLKNEIYEVSVNGVANTEIFADDEDRARFLFLILFLQSPALLNNSSWYTNNYLKKGLFRVNNSKTDLIAKEREVALMAFSIGKSKATLLIQNLKDMVLSVYMQRVLTAYSKYYNAKYKRRGHVLSGPFEAIHLTSVDDLKTSFSKIHANLEQSVNSDSFYKKEKSPKNNLEPALEKLISTSILKGVFRTKT